MQMLKTKIGLSFLKPLFNESGHEALVMNPEKDFAHLNSTNVSLSGFSSSANGRYMSYRVIAGGNESHHIEVINDLQSG